MKCNFPVTAWAPSDGGALVFSEHQSKDAREIQIPCGQCMGCRIRKQDAWATRLFLESRMHEHKYFITLTYDDDHIPADWSLHYSDIQRFFYRMRDRLGKFRYFVSGEYGERLSRPHWHLMLFGLELPDLVRANMIRSKHTVYKCEALSSLWPFGFHSIGEVNYTTASYCAKYTIKKVTGERAEAHYRRVDPETGEVFQLVPEFSRMSLKPGIGATWLAKYWPEVYNVHDAVIVNGSKKPVPRYFNKLMDKLDDVHPTYMDGVEYKRVQNALEHSADNTADRLAVREACLKARVAFFEEQNR